MIQILEKLTKNLEKNKKEYLKYLKELIAIKTENIGHGIEGGFEKEGQLYLKKLLKEIGFKIKFQEMKESNIEKAISDFNEGDLGHNYHERFNLIAEYDEKKEGKIILFNGHIDTMPATELQSWKINPYIPEEKEGKLYGIGSTDMKAGLMASILSTKLLKDSGIEIPGKIKILSVVDEEGGGNGTINACIEGINADACVVAEPTDKKIIKAHMGFLVFKLKIKGKAIHSGKKWEGENAIEKAFKINNFLKELEFDWIMKYKNPNLPSPTINLGKIIGGNAASTVPGMCELHYCIHFIPEMNMEDVEQEVRKVIKRAFLSDEFLFDLEPEIEIYQRGNPFEYKGSLENIKALEESTEVVYNKKQEVTGIYVGNDARLMMNIAKIPTLIAGPGNISQCHTVNEYIEIEEFYNYILLYAIYILKINKII